MPTLPTLPPAIDLAVIASTQRANRLGITTKQACAQLMRKASDECQWASLAAYTAAYTYLSTEES